ncbi:hypothetical protein [Cyclobacterium xiamenense]
MKSIGFDHLIDFKKTNFTKTGDTCALLLDCKTNQYRYTPGLT